MHKIILEPHRIICRKHKTFHGIHKISQEAQKLFCKIKKNFTNETILCKYFFRCTKPFNLRLQDCDILSITVLYSYLTRYRTELKELLRTESKHKGRWIAYQCIDVNSNVKIMCAWLISLTSLQGSMIINKVKMFGGIKTL